MNDQEREELEGLLREALRREAARVVPAGDGLERIRARVAVRRRGWGWLRPVVAVAAAAAVVALVGIAPQLLRHDGPSSPRDVSIAPASRQAAPKLPHPNNAVPDTGPHTAAAPNPAGTMTARSQGTPLPPSSGLPDMRTVWPYGSRQEGSLHADADSSQRPALADPDETARQFVESFVGTQDDLTFDEAVKFQAGVRVPVFRELAEGGRQAVSLVYLVRVRPSDRSPYVVVDAESPGTGGQSDSVSLDPGALDGTSAMLVDGTASSKEEIASVKVELREPGRDEVLAESTPSLATDAVGSAQQTWSAELTPIRALSTPTGTVAAWTVDSGNHLLGFAAEPTG